MLCYQRAGASVFDFVVVNWNSGDHLRAAVYSLKAHHNGLVARVIIVDNASMDGSLDFLEEFVAPFPIDLHVNLVNNGFAVACNQGALLCSSEYVVFFNPDAQVLPDTLPKIAKCLGAPPGQIGIVGPQNLNVDGSIARSCARFPSVGSYLMDGLGLTRLPLLHRFSQRMLEWDHAHSAFVDQVIGAFFVVRRDLFGQLGGFDERFFVYLEEVDFSLRARKLGFLTYYLAEAKAIHYGGGSSENVKAMRLFYSLRSRIQYVCKHFGWAGMSLVLLNTLTLELGLRALFGLRAGGIRATQEVARGYWHFFKCLPGLLKKPMRGQRANT